MIKFIVVILAIVGAVAINDKIQAEGGWDQFLIVASSDVDCKPEVVTSEVQIYKDKNGDDDFGYRVIATIKNVGKSGKIWLRFKLITPEGEWMHVYVNDMGAGVTKQWYSDFPEPTIRSDPFSVKAQIMCKPGWKTT